MTLFERLPDPPTPDNLFETFSAWTVEQGLALYPAQTDALIELVSGSHVILATPTGSGKSLTSASIFPGRLRQAVLTCS